MFKQALVILAGLLVLCIGSAAVAFVGAPLPYGRPGKLPEPINQYWIYKEKEIGSLNPTECCLELYYQAPEWAEIEYVLKDAEGNCLVSGVEARTGKEGKITLVLKTPEAGKAYSISFESTCRIIKPDLKEIVVGTWSCAYSVSCDLKGYVDFEKANR